MRDFTNEVEIQRQYYATTASQYDSMHLSENDEHYFALAFLTAILDYLKIKSVLDVGAGTGRAIAYLKQAKPNLVVIGVEPSKELREMGYAKGIPKEELIDGDATNLGFEDGAFDLVCEFAVLHHIKRPDLAVSEMLRVANKAVFISDSNNFGQGSPLVRLIKQLLNSMGLWKIVDFIKTKGKGYTISEGDGLGYSYSVFDNYRQIQEKCKRIHLLNTQDGHFNLYRTASHVVLLGVKPPLLP